MSITVTDYHRLIEIMCQHKTLSAEKLRKHFYKRFSYSELVELLCDFINANHLLDNCLESEDIGNLMITVKTLKEELKLERSSLSRCQNQLLCAQKEAFELKNQMVQLTHQNILLKSREDNLKLELIRLQSKEKPHTRMHECLP